MKYFLFILFVSTSAISLAQKSMDALLEQYNTRSVKYISVTEARMLQKNPNIVFLDTRELEEFKVSHISSAENVGFNNFSIEKISEKIIDKNTPIIVYCSIGIRSEEIGEKLQKAGFTNVKNLYGGIFEWKNKDFPIINSKQQETDSVHTFSKIWSKWLTNGIKTY